MALKDITLTPNFAAVAAANMTLAEFATLDPWLDRRPRLLVPIDVQGLRLRPDDEFERGDVGTGGVLRNVFSEDPAAAADIPDPFTPAKDPLSPGVHLRWAMPDALMRGIVSVEDESKAHADSELVMPPLPNRWTVFRVWFDSGKRRFRSKGWVVEADRGRKVPIEEWSESAELPEGAEAATPDLLPEDLTATVGGDAAWVTIYDNVVNRFALHDDLADLPEKISRVSYVVTGWYSDPKLDPIHGASSKTRFDDRLDDLRWQTHLGRLQAIYSSRKAATRATEALGGGAVGGTEVVDASTGKSVPIGAVTPDVFAAAGSVTAKQDPWWPQSCVFHGSVIGVPTKALGGDLKPKPTNVEVGVGANGAESLAALIAATQVGTTSDLSERLLTAFQYGLMETFGESDGIPRLEEEIHGRTFESEPGGSITEWIRFGDAFSHLRTKKARPARPTGGLDILDIGDVKSFMDFEEIGFSEAMEKHAAKGILYSEWKSTEPTKEVASFYDSDSVQILDPNSPIDAAREGVGRSITRIEPTSMTAEYVDEHQRRVVLEDSLRRPPRELDYQEVRRPNPRFFYPQDPVVTLRGGGRSLIHGGDGRFDPEGRLWCRVSGTGSTQYSGLATAAELLPDQFLSGQVPPEVKELLYESVVIDSSAVVEVDQAIRSIRNIRVSEQLSTRLRAEASYRRRSLVSDVDSGVLSVPSIVDGTMASPVATTVWNQPWVPIYLEWKLTLAVDDDLTKWSSGEIDFELEEKLTTDDATRVTGRSLLSAGSAKSLATAIGKYLAEEENLDNVESASEGVLDTTSQNLLGDLNDIAGDVDTLSGALDGIRYHLLGFDSEVLISDLEDDEPEIPPERAPQLLAGGAGVLTDLRIVDAFGRFLDVPLGSNVVSSESIEPDTGDVSSDDAGVPLLLPPRIQQPSRLWFRFVDAGDDLADSFVDQRSDTATRNPVCGWLLPDHVDRALEVFDTAGDPVGQLRHERLGEAVVWEGPPGAPGPLGSAPFTSIENAHTAELVRAVVQRHAAERQAVDFEDQESPLEALLRVIDTTLWTVDPFSQAGMDYYATLTGRPIAVVRARLLLDVQNDVEQLKLAGEAATERSAAYEELTRRVFDVRLGSLTRAEDGLLGYFVNDDYWHFYPVHARVPQETLPSGPSTGYLGPYDSVPDFDENAEPEPVTQPYVVADPTVSVRAGQSVRLTLLMDPGGRAHATSGILPRKSIALPRDFVDEGLQRIAPSFRIGPVLVDPTTIRMPRPSGLPEEQAWTRRDSTISWRDDPIVAASQHAYLPDTSAMAQEGYIRISIEQEED